MIFPKDRLPRKIAIPAPVDKLTQIAPTLRAAPGVRVLNPRTVLYLGYTDNYVGNQDFHMIQTDHTFFAKIGYAWTL